MSPGLPVGRMGRPCWRRWALGLAAALSLLPSSAAQSVLSADGRWRVRALADAVVVEAAGSGAVMRRHPSTALAGGAASTVSEVHLLPQRRSVLVAFTTLPELWEISFDPQAAPIYNGLVHDYPLGEAIALDGFLNPRRTLLPEPLAGLAFSTTQAWVLGRAGPAASSADGQARLLLVQLDIRRVTAEHRLPGQPDTRAARPAFRHGRQGLWVPDAAGGAGAWVDLGIP